MKYCAQCGASNADDAAFCEKCGNTFETPSLDPASAAPVVASVVPKKSAKGLVIALLVGVLVILAALGGYWALLLKPMSASDYEREVSKSAAAAVEATGDWSYEVGSIDVSWDDNPVGDENLELLRTRTKKAVSRIDKVREDLAALRPPKEYEDAHAQLLEGIDSLSAALNSTSAMFNKMTGDDSLNSGGEMMPSALSFQEELMAADLDMKEALVDMGLFEEVFPDQTVPE